MTTLGLADWPSAPEPVDPTGRSWLVVACGDGESDAVAADWATAAERLGPTVRLAIDSCDGPGRDTLVATLAACRTGVRVMVVGNQHDVLTALALARQHGAGASELRCFVVDDGMLPIFCAHCRDTHRVTAEPGGTVDCPGCGRHLEVHPHHSALRGSYLASDARARELA